MSNSSGGVDETTEVWASPDPRAKPQNEDAPQRTEDTRKLLSKEHRDFAVEVIMFDTHVTSVTSLRQTSLKGISGTSA